MKGLGESQTFLIYWPSSVPFPFAAMTAQGFQRKWGQNNDESCCNYKPSGDKHEARVPLIL
jgi:hypothetical protein